MRSNTLAGNRSQTVFKTREWNLKYTAENSKETKASAGPDFGLSFTMNSVDVITRTDTGAMRSLVSTVMATRLKTKRTKQAR